jgi:diketogulonate reductase-like aldo/keto reductase
MTDMTDINLTGGGAIPLVGFGTWQLRGAGAYEAVGQALKVGYRHLDTATMYRNEAECGRALRESGVPRGEVFVTTKLPGERFDRARATLADSLRALDTGYVDLWLIHWPGRGAGVEVWRELLAARDAGLARAVGVSNYSTAQIDELIKATGEVPAVNQIPWSPSQHDPRQVEELRERGVVLEGYSPIKGTNLRNPVLVELAQRYGVSVPQVVLRWHVEHGIVVIPKSAKPERIAANFDIFGFALEPAEVAAIDALADLL